MFLIAIVAYQKNGFPAFAKYVHNIKNNEHYKKKFLKDMLEKFPSLTHINFYDKKTGDYLERVYPMGQK